VSETKGKLDTWLDGPPLGDRAAAREICAAARPGDTVIYTGLSRAAVSFYLHRFGCASRLSEISHPAEFERHLGWEDPRRYYSRELAVQREAERAVQSAASSGRRIFLLYHPDPRFSAAIVRSLQYRYRMASSKPFVSCPPCFTELRLYDVTPEAQPR
jgi:hypothetical protein